MKPTVDTTLSRPDLGQVVYEVMQDSLTMGFIGLSVMPIFVVPEHEGTYPVIPKEALFNVHDTKRAPNGAYNRIGEEFEEGFFRTQESGLEYPLDDRFSAVYKSKLNTEIFAARILANAMLRDLEMKVKAKVFNTSNFDVANASTAWSTTGSADPLADVEAGKDTLRSSGVEADTLIIPYDGLKWLRQNDELKDMVYKVFPDAAKTGRVTLDHIKTVFDVPKVLIAGGLYNSSKKGQAASLSDIWGSRYSMLCKTSDGDISEPCIGRSFLWNEGDAGTGDWRIVEQYRDETTRKTILRVRHDLLATFLASYDEDGNVKSEISKACGYMIDMTAAT
jgi:hypothetical protein